MRLLVLFDVCVSAECFLSGLICVASRVYMCKCTMYSVCVPLGIRVRPHYWLDLGEWSCSSLASFRLQDASAPTSDKNKDWKYKTGMSSNLLNFITPQNKSKNIHLYNTLF